MFDWVVGVIERLGHWGVALLTFLENLFPPIPSELVIPLAGFVAARGELQLWLVIVMGSLGSLAGAVAYYEVGRSIGERRLRAWIDRHGKWLTLGRHDVDKAQQWFDRHGASAVLLGRLVPGVRTFVSLPAGFAGMPRAPFIFYSAIGTVAWTAALAYAGKVLQANYTLVGDYLDVATIVVFGALAATLVVRYVRCWRSTPRG